MHITTSTAPTSTQHAHNYMYCPYKYTTHPSLQVLSLTSTRHTHITTSTIPYKYTTHTHHYKYYPLQVHNTHTHITTSTIPYQHTTHTTPTHPHPHTHPSLQVLSFTSTQHTHITTSTIPYKHTTHTSLFDARRPNAN